MPGDFFPIILFFTSRSSPQTHFSTSRVGSPRGGGRCRAMPQVIHTHRSPWLGRPAPARRPARAPLPPPRAAALGVDTVGVDTRGLPGRRGPRSPTARSWQLPRRAAVPERRAAPTPQRRGRLSPSIISCGPSPLSAAILLLPPPPPSGNRLDRCRSQSEPSAGDAPQPITPAGGTLGGGAAPRPPARMRSGPASFWGL